MSEHRHTSRVGGCFRCELGRDEEIASIAEDYWDEILAPPMTAAGAPAGMLASMRRRYVSDARLNEVAVRELYAWVDQRDVDSG